MTSFNYQEKLKNNKNKSVKDLIKKLYEEGIKRGPNSKNNMEYITIAKLNLSDLAKILTDVQEKKALGMKNKIDRLTVENWGNKDVFIKYIKKNNLHKGTDRTLNGLKLDKLKDIILKEHLGLSPRSSPSSSPRSSPSSSPRKSSSSPRSSPSSSPRKKSPVEYEIDPSTKKKRKSCKKNQIRNPKKGRCVINRNYKSPSSSSRKSSSSPRSSPSSSPRKKSPVEYEIDPSTKKKRKSCKKNQIRNPKTERCVINRNYKSPSSSPLKNGMISCKKCGSSMLKIKLKKHQESNKCKKSPRNSIDTNTPIKRRKKRKNVIDEDSEDERVSPKSTSSGKSSKTASSRKSTSSGKSSKTASSRKSTSTPKSSKTASSRKSTSTPKSSKTASSRKSTSTPKSSKTPKSTSTPIKRGKRRNVIDEDSESETEEESSENNKEQINNWDELKNKLCENNLISNENVDNESFRNYDLIKRMIFDSYCNHYGNILIDNSNDIYDYDEYGFVNCLKKYNCGSDIKNPLSFNINDEFILTSFDDKFLVFISIEENSFKYYFDIQKQRLEFIEEDTFDFSIENIDMDEIDNLANKPNKTIFENFSLIIIKKYNVFSKPSITSLNSLNNYFNSMVLSFSKIHLIHFALNDKIFIEDSLNLSASDKLIFEKSKIEKNRTFLSYINGEKDEEKEEGEEKDEEKEEEEEKEKEEDDEDEEEEEEEKEKDEDEDEDEDDEDDEDDKDEDEETNNISNISNIENDHKEDDDLYVSEKSMLEEGDEVNEVEEIDDSKDIDSKLNEINNIVLKNDKLVKNSILRHLGLL